MRLSNITMQKFNDTKSFIRVTITGNIRTQKLTTLEIQQKCLNAIAQFKNSIPQKPAKMRDHLTDSLSAYREGFFDCAIEGKTVFLYLVDGKFYRTGNVPENLEHLPKWDTLPRNLWDDLGEHGGIYWVDTLNQA